MGLFQNLLETYEKCSAAIGVVRFDAEGNANEKKTLLPICHTTFKSEIHVRIDKEGKFINASRDNKATTIIIPCTEKSEGRTSGIAAHPLCDQLDYVGGINDIKTKTYLSELDSWKDDIVELNAIHTYVSGKTMMDDLSNSGIFKDSEYRDKGEGNAKQALDTEKIRKIGIRFTIQIDDAAVNVWESMSLRNAWISHINNGAICDEAAFDYLSGGIIGNVATQHPKNINSFTGNAKLLSCNDASGFTFRGRFAQQDDAVIIDYGQSQKMHQMLRWLIANCGYAVDSQVIVTWAVDDEPEVNAKAQDDSRDIFFAMATVKTDADILSEASTQVYTDYAAKLNKLLMGYGNARSIREHFRKICIAVFDAATTGRMGLVFYQEFPENTYHESIVNWHNDTSYYQTTWEKCKDANGKEKKVLIHHISAPSYDDILFAVYGQSRGDKAYDVLKKKIRKQLLECMFGNFPFPESMVKMAANRASRPMSFTDSNGKFNENDWKRSINITCALARKFYKKKGGEIELALNTERRDRDYLFGRLLAVADKLERVALYKAGKQETRATNAVKLMSAFQVKPSSTWGQIYSQLMPYRNQLNGAGYYQTLIDEIMDTFHDGDFEKNDSLAPLYLLGYSAQSRALSQKNKNDHSEEANDGDTAE